MLGAQFGDQLNFGQHCPFGDVEESETVKVDVVYRTDVADGQPGWKITAENASAYYCTGGGQFPDEVVVSGLDVNITVVDLFPGS